MKKGKRKGRKRPKKNQKGTAKACKSEDFIPARVFFFRYSVLYHNIHDHLLISTAATHGIQCGLASGRDKFFQPMVDNFHIHLIKIRWKGPNYQTVVASEHTVATKRRIAEGDGDRFSPRTSEHGSHQSTMPSRGEFRKPQNMCMHIYMYIYTHVCIHIYIYTYVYVYVYLHVYVYVYVYIYTYSFCISSFEELCAQRQIVHSEQSKSNVQTSLSAANVLTCAIVPKLYNGFTPLLPK